MPKLDMPWHALLTANLSPTLKLFGATISCAGAEDYRRHWLASVSACAGDSLRQTCCC